MTSYQDGKYVTVESLGEGAFGKVESVRRREDGTMLALKFVNLSCAPPAVVDQAMSEIALLKRLHHPGIVHYADSFMHGRNLCIVMELLTNGTLTTLVETSKPSGGIPLAKVKPLIRCMLEALEYLHLKKTIHRDIKPDNVLLSSDGSPRLADFGVSKPLSATSFAMTLTGTPAFMAPEVLSYKPYNFSADIWSLGATFYYVLSNGEYLVNSGEDVGRLIHGGASWRMPPLPARVPSAYSDLVSSMLRVEPTARPEVSDLLLHAAISIGSHSGLPISPSPSPGPQPAPFVVSGHCSHCRGGDFACACTSGCPRQPKSACIPGSTRHCAHCKGGDGACACSSGCPRQLSNSCVPASERHCSHCRGGDGGCACDSGCPRNPSNRCTPSTRHCSHCSGKAAACSCEAGCTRPSRATCTPLRSSPSLTAPASARSLGIGSCVLLAHEVAGGSLGSLSDKRMGVILADDGTDRPFKV